jgi:hypothetical protein
MLEALSDEDWKVQKDMCYLWEKMESKKLSSSVRAVWSKKLEDKLKAESEATAMASKAVPSCRLHPNLPHTDAQCFKQGAPRPPDYQPRPPRNNDNTHRSASANIALWQRLLFRVRSRRRQAIRRAVRRLRCEPSYGLRRLPPFGTLRSLRGPQGQSWLWPAIASRCCRQAPTGRLDSP